MNVLIKYWSDDWEVVEFWSSTILKMGSSFNLLYLISDGPNINLQFLNYFEERRYFAELHAPLIIRKLGLHTVSETLKNATRASSWNVREINKNFI